MNTATKKQTGKLRQPESADDLILFDSFARGKQIHKTRTGNCVIYTRVSTKEQTDGMSLEIQRKACEQYALKNGYSIKGYFGGTYESAKTDERKQFNAMLSFVKKSSEKISHIIVYSVDRFSRSGANAIYIAEQLKKEGIALFAVTQPSDATTASGSLQQNIQFIFSEYDNQLRREKCMAGMKETLLTGVWIAKPPLGYDIIRKNGERQFTLNRTGKLIAKAFRWKAEGMSSEAVRQKLGEHGLHLPNQRVSDILRNPFYCGLIVHASLEGKIIEGIQEKAVSKELFLQVNGILSAGHQSGYSIKPENDDVPLKRFIKCEYCGNYLRAYKAYKNQQYYYKCNTVGCKCNKRAEGPDGLHKKFLEKLASLSLNVNDDVKRLIIAQMVRAYKQLTGDREETKVQLNGQIDDLTKKIDRLEERYIAEEIDRDMFLRYKEKFVSERTELQKALAKTNHTVSNLEDHMEQILSLASKLTPLWGLQDYEGQQKLQFLVFPEGMLYNRKNDECRTERVNTIFSTSAALARISGENKSGNNAIPDIVPALVVWGGIEPPTQGFSVLCSTD